MLITHIVTISKLESELTHQTAVMNMNPFDVNRREEGWIDDVESKKNQRITG